MQGLSKRGQKCYLKPNAGEYRKHEQFKPNVVGDVDPKHLEAKRKAIPDKEKEAVDKAVDPRNLVKLLNGQEVEFL